MNIHYSRDFDESLNSKTFKMKFEANYFVAFILGNNVADHDYNGNDYTKLEIEEEYLEYLSDRDFICVLLVMFLKMRKDYFENFLVSSFHEFRLKDIKFIFTNEKNEEENFEFDEMFLEFEIETTNFEFDEEIEFDFSEMKFQI